MDKRWRNLGLLVLIVVILLVVFVLLPTFEKKTSYTSIVQKYSSLGVSWTDVMDNNLVKYNSDRTVSGLNLTKIKDLNAYLNETRSSLSSKSDANSVALMSLTDILQKQLSIARDKLSIYSDLLNSGNLDCSSTTDLASALDKQFVVLDETEELDSMAISFLSNYGSEPLFVIDIQAEEYFLDAIQEVKDTVDLGCIE